MVISQLKGDKISFSAETSDCKDVYFWQENNFLQKYYQTTYIYVKMGKQIIATFYIGRDDIAVEVWLCDNGTLFIGVYKLQYRSFFSKKLWKEYITYSDTLLQNNQEGCKVLGTKKQLTVKDSVVKCTTRDTPPHHFVLDAIQWMYLMEINERIQKVINEEERHYLIHCSTDAYLMLKSTPYPCVVFEQSDIRQTENGIKNIRKRYHATTKSY